MLNLYNNICSNYSSDNWIDLLNDKHIVSNRNNSIKLTVKSLQVKSNTLYSPMLTNLSSEQIPKQMNNAHGLKVPFTTTLLPSGIFSKAKDGLKVQIYAFCLKHLLSLRICPQK